MPWGEPAAGEAAAPARRVRDGGGSRPRGDERSRLAIAAAPASWGWGRHGITAAWAGDAAAHPVTPSRAAGAGGTRRTQRRSMREYGHSSLQTPTCRLPSEFQGAAHRPLTTSGTGRGRYAASGERVRREPARECAARLRAARGSAPAAGEAAAAEGVRWRHVSATAEAPGHAGTDGPNLRCVGTLQLGAEAMASPGCADAAGVARGQHQPVPGSRPLGQEMRQPTSRHDCAARPRGEGVWRNHPAANIPPDCVLRLSLVRACSNQ